MSTDPLSACNVIAPATENAPTRPRSARLSKLQAYWVLTKSRQTLLLLAAGLAGYLSARPAEPSARTIVWMALSLFLAVSGTTALNMVADRDIDARMTRTTNRPLPAGLISPLQATIFALALTLIGLAAAFALDGLFGLLISAGVFFDLVIYTFWLKRRSPSSIIFGGISGAMPILAGRALCTGAVDGLGIVLALSILLWIPSHIMPLWIRYAADYAEAGGAVVMTPRQSGRGPRAAAIALVGVDRWGIERHDLRHAANPTSQEMAEEAAAFHRAKLLGARERIPAFRIPE